MAKNFITETMVLPSATTKLYGDSFNGHITLRAMTTDEERMRLGGQSFHKTMASIINECIVDNKNPDGTYKLNSEDFTDFDFFAILVKLRIMSYGPKYRTVATCLKCGHRWNHVVDLSELAYNLVPEDFKEPYTIGPLPSSGDILGCRFLRIRDRIEIEKQKDLILAKNPDFQGDPTYNLEMEKRIMTVNDKDLDYVTAPDYVHGMIAMDNYVYHEEIDKDKRFGVVNYGFVDKCDNPSKCDGTSLWAMKVDSEFFRPCLND